MKRTIISVLLVIATAVVAYPQESKSIHPNPGNSVTRTLRAAGNFKTFLSLLEKAGLKNLGLVPTDQKGSSVPVDRRVGSVQERPGNDPRYQTVFAPNDAAFARLPPGALETLKKDRACLRSFLLAHMLPGKLMVEDLFDPIEGGKTFKAANGSDLSLIWTAGKDGMSSLQINGKARVGKFQDVMASDYLIVIHEIDAVLIGDGSVRWSGGCTRSPLTGRLSTATRE